ncbi:PKD domain-containing protein [Brumimicrobium oceani]|uniref:PKD domain-containing protein n=1 Tax=Brumimicrobium oceani TaxID=2100725 RepID=A0A2U2XF90_9FLAO|nr:PKD domain-containing protein [Brumimicrobium oceani]PWH86468.1 hypothetical protein DIT68_04315 [Brumimicrobium oceani]
MRNFLPTLIVCVFFIFNGNSQNCPSYSTAVTASGEACAGQNYSMTFENSSCNSELFFDYNGTLTTGGSVQVISQLSGVIVYSETGTGSYNGTIGPLDPAVHGTDFTLTTVNGTYTLTQNGVTAGIAVDETSFFSLKPTISSATLNVTTPSGIITKTVDFCKDISLGLTLANTDFCTTTNINLPWEIVCDETNTVLASGTHAVVVYPEVPSDPNDLVEIIWNSTTCTWDVTAQFDCDNSDIGTIFDISPTPSTVPANACVDGSEIFTITYNGFAAGPNCCSTSGPKDPIQYNSSTPAVVANSPFGGSNNAGYVNIPPNNSGGSANSLSLDVAVNSYCFNHTDPSGTVSVYVDNIVVANYPFATPNFSYGFNLPFIPWYDENSTVEVYVFPNALSNGGNNTTYSPATSCSALNPMEWSGNISVALNVEFEDSIGSGLTCSNDTTIAFTNCTPADPILTLETAADCNVNSTVAITNYDNSLSYTFAPVGPVVSPTGIVSGPAGTYTISGSNGSCAGDQTFTIDPGKTIPSFTLSATDPSVCAGTDGTITLSGLDNSTTFNVSYDDGGTTVGPLSITSNASGEAVITGLSAGSYSNFSVELNACIGTDNSTIGLSDPNGPTVDAGAPQTICTGSSVTLTALGYPAGATISWDNGVTDGVPFTPANTQTYTVTVLLNGCSATDDVTVTLTPQDIPTFNAIANFCENTAAPSLPAMSNENITGTWNPATISNTIVGATTYTFTPDAGLCAATATLDVTVDPEPNPTITAPSDICVASASVTLTANPVGGTFSGNGMSGADFDPAVAGLGTHTITYTFTDGNGCTGSSTVDIEVNTDLDFTLASTNPTACGGTDGSITISGLENSTVYSVSYDNGGIVGPTNFVSNASGEVMISGLNAGAYTTFFVGSGGCFSTDNTTLNLSDPNAPTVNAGTDQTVCEGTPVTLTATNPDGAAISWDQGITDGVAFTPTTTQTYTVTANLNNCISTDDVTVTVNAQTVPTFGVATAFCENDTPPTLPTVSNESVNGTWSPAVVATTLGTATYTFTPNAGECATNQTIDITVNPLPTPTIDPIADICEFAATVSLGGTPTGGVFSGPGVVGGDFDPSVAGLGTHTITYTYTDGNACSADATTTVLVNTNIVFDVSFTDPTVCNGTDGTVVIEGLDPNDVYEVSYFNGATVGPNVMNSNSSGNIVIPGLSAGAYSDFEVIFNGCQGINNSSIVLNDPIPPTIDAGLDQEVCPGSAVTLTAFNPDGASIAWDNGVTDGASFVPPVGINTYTVTAGLLNCISTDQVTVTVHPPLTGITAPTGVTASCNISQQPPYADLDAFLADGGTVSLPAGGKIDSASFTMLGEVSDGGSCPETITRTYQLTDVCGVSVSATQTIIVNDDENPTGTAPADLTVQCVGDLPAADVTSITDEADNCTVNPTVTHVGDVTTGSGCLITVTRTYNIADDCGNNIDVVQVITISDDTAPTATVPTDTLVMCAGDIPAADIALITDEADNCTANPTVTFVSDVSDGNTCPEVITRTYNIADDCGNNVDLVQVITVNDTVSPTASNPDTLFVACLTDVPVFDVAIITDEADNCTVSPVVSFVSEVTDGNTCAGELITRTYRVTDDCSNFTDLTQIISIGAEDPNFSVAGNDPSTCNGTDGTIVISGLTPSTNYDLTYDGGTATGITSNAAGEYVITGLSAGTYTDYTVAETTCSACSTTENVSITLTDPTPPAVNAGSDLQVCEGETVTLTATNPDAANISWNNGVTDGVGFVPTVGSLTYTVTAELANCTTTDDVIVVVSPLPNVSAGNMVEVCEGEEVTLSGSGAVTYTWDNGVLDGVPFTPTLGTQTYTVTGTSASGCENTDQVDVSVLEVPVVSFTANTREGCAPEEINLISTSPGVGNQCRFTIGGNVMLNGCNVSHVFTDADCYDVTLEVELANGCSDTETMADYICIDNYPIADFSIEPEELTTFNNEAEFTNESSGAVTYQWEFGDSTYSNSVNPIHEYSVLGNPAERIYEVKLIAYSDLGCADSIIGDLPFFEDLIYNVPNTFTPDGNLFNESFKPVFTSGFDPMEYNLKIYNRWGEVIFESNDPAYGWDGTFGASNIKFAPEGTYIWKISFKKLKDDENVEEIGSVNLLR